MQPPSSIQRVQIHVLTQHRPPGWRFATADEKEPGETHPDPIHPDYTHIRQIYFENDKDYSGRFTVPTLYDVKQRKIVNNESSEILRMLYHAFDPLLPEKFRSVDLLPKELEKEIDETNEWTYNEINNGKDLLIHSVLKISLTVIGGGVYKSGFAT